MKKDWTLVGEKGTIHFDGKEAYVKYRNGSLVYFNIKDLPKWIQAMDIYKDSIGGMHLNALDNE